MSLVFCTLSLSQYVAASLHFFIFFLTLGQKLRELHQNTRGLLNLNDGVNLIASKSLTSLFLFACFVLYS